MTENISGRGKLLLPLPLEAPISALMITSPKNQRIKDAQKLSSKRHREQTQTLLIEGLRLVRDAVDSGVRPQTIFYAPDLLTSAPAANEFIAQLDSAGLECVSCSEAVFAALTNTVTPQGIAAIVPLCHLPLPHLPTFALLLDQVRDPGNAGTLLRSAEAAGVEQVLFAPDTVDPFNDKVVRAAMGAHFRLPLRVCRDWEQIQEMLPAGTHYYLAEANAALAYDQVDWRQPAALVVGGEAAGASAPALRLATPVAIPMLGHTESLNASVAGAVILFEAARQRRHNVL
ncbi:MAG: RNA methyltransferase [Caldilineaceae bacterium]